MRARACRVIWLGAAGVCAAFAAQPGLPEVLSWLPADTETVISANGPFALKDFDALARGSAGVDAPSAEELKLQMEGLAAGLFSLENGGLGTFLNGGKMALVVEGSRRFRRPKELGAMLFEGCAFAIMDDPAAIDSDAFMHKAAASAKRIENIEGLQIAVFEQKQEEDVWTTFVGFPRINVALVATNEDYLRTVLARMRGPAGPRALPETLPEWKYVNTGAPVWAVRHYQRSDAALDPTSPFHGKDAHGEDAHGKDAHGKDTHGKDAHGKDAHGKDAHDNDAVNAGDPDAAGVAFWFDPDGGAAILTYLSANTGSRKMVENFLGLTGPASESFPKSRVQFRQPAQGVLECSLPLAIPKALAIVPILGLMAMFGHAVYSTSAGG